MKIKSHSFLFQLLALAVILLGYPSMGYAKPLRSSSLQIGQAPLLCITSAPNITAFPNVVINFRMLDANLMPVTPGDADLRFAENGQTPVPLVGSIQSDPYGGGIDYYIIVDRGNRSSQTAIRSILQNLVSFGYYNEKTDSVRIYTNEGNSSQLYFPGGTSGNTLSEAVANFPVKGDSNYRQVTQSFEKVLGEIESSPDACKNMRVILMIMGDDALSENDVLKYSQRVRTSLAKLAVFHVSGSTGNGFGSGSIYSNLANLAGGTYRQIKSLDTDIKPGFDDLVLYKQLFSATYRTNFGAPGKHSITAIYQNTNVAVQGQSNYSVDILSPTVSLVGEATVNRAAQSKTETGDYIYEFDSLPYVVQISWNDSYPREIKEIALVVKEGEAENETVVPFLSKGDNTYEVNWNFSLVKSSGQHTLYLSVRVTDEFGYQAISEPFKLILTNNTQIADKPPAWASAMLITLGSVVVILLILMVFMWRKMLSFAKQGGAVIGKIAGEIRKTIVGGGRRGKPLATFKVLEGPPNMIGQELKVYTESVKLGRNPQLADMTFYAPDVITSVSGLHARLEKVSGVWRIVALSQSGSETFVDEQAISFNEPVRIHSGQKIRLGYFAQQPVVLEFHTDQVEQQYTTSVDHTDGDVRKTNVKVDPDETNADGVGFFSRPNRGAPQAEKKRSTEKSDSVFDEFR